MGEENAFAAYEALASSLPTCRGLGRAPYRKYGDFMYPANLMAPTLAMRDEFVARSSDVVLATMPKSGTTWLKALVFAVARRGRHAPDDARHPLLCSSPHDLVPFLHTLYESHHPDPPSSRLELEEMPPPRILAVHAPFSLLQASSLAESGCRIVYLCRDPKDALVSFWHYIDKAAPPSSTACLAPFPEVFELFCDGVSPFGPVWDHMAEYWKESVARPEEVMFLRYEHLQEDTVGSVKRLAEFLGCPFTAEEVARGVPEAVVALCSMDRMRSVKANRDGEHGVGWTFKNSAFFRKGDVGDWKELMTPEMAWRIDAIVEEKLLGSGLSMIHN
jgi:estrone sulfotransferase